MADNPQKEQDRPLPPPSIEARVKKVEYEHRELLKSNDLIATIHPVFPQYNILPPEVKLALLVLQDHKVEYKFAYTDKKGAAA